MYKGKVICVVVPAFNEELLLPETLSGMPDYVDKIIVIDDYSTDRTYELLTNFQKLDDRIEAIRHDRNMGLGQSLIDGYIVSKNGGSDITVIMAGDNQMNPEDLPVLLNKIIDEKYDYVKGNRLLHQNVSSMPKHRFIGNSVLTILTKFATGYYFSMDPQCGYTAISNEALRQIPIERMTKGYGYNADILCMLNIQRFSVADAQVSPVYDREKSKIILWKYIPKTAWILVKLFIRRMWLRYLVLDFHPLVLFFMFAAFNILFILIPGLIRILYMFITHGEFPLTTFSIVSIAFLLTVQLILFGIWMDMDYNRDPKRR